MSSILQWNVNGIQNKIQEIKMIMNNYNSIKILCIQETHLKPHYNFTLKDHILYRMDHDEGAHASRGLLTAIHKSIHSEELQLNTTLEAQAIKVFGHLNFTICNIYLPPAEPLSEIAIVNLLQQLPVPFIIVGDINAQHYAWGGDFNNSRGNLIHRIIDGNDLLILNDGSKTHFSLAYGSESALDISVCSPTIHPHLSWHTLEDFHGSDHRPIKITFANRLTDDSRPQSWVTDRADWGKFSKLAVINVTDLPLDINECNSTIVTTILSAAIKSIPQTSPTPRKKNNAPWFDRECAIAVNAKKTAWKKWKQSPTTPNLINYKRLAAIVY